MGLFRKKKRKEVSYYPEMYQENRIDGKTAEEWFKMGLEAKDFKEEIECYDKVLEIDPKFAAAWNNKGLALRKLGRYDEAVECYDKALKIKPKFAAAWNNKGFALSNLGRYEEEIECYNKAIEIDPKDAAAWYNKGVVLDDLGRYEEAIECYDRALKIDPKDAAAWNNKGLALRKLGRYDEAIKCCDRALEIDPKFVLAWNNKGVALDDLGRCEEAIKCYDKALEIDPKYAYAWKNKGFALFNMGRYDEAIKCYDKAIEIKPKYANAWKNKGIGLIKLGKREEGEECLKKALELYNTNLAEKEDRFSLYGKADVLRELGRYDEAIKNIEKALRLSPNDIDLLYMKGKILLESGKSKEASTVLEEVLSRSPNMRDAVADLKKVRKMLNSEIRKAEEHERNKEFARAAEIYRSIGYGDRADEMYGLDRKLKKAKGYEKALNYERAVELYEELEMWDDARRCREAIKEHSRKKAIKRHINIPKEEEKIDLTGIGDYFSYKIGRRIGHGGFSKVHLVEDEDGNEFAMKIPLDADLKEEETLELPERVLKGFIKEARIWNTLTERNIPGIVQLYGFGVRPFPWFVMDLCDESLAQRMKEMEFGEKIDVLVKILNTLNEIHYLGIVHRDIKPQNILFKDGEPLLTDFGLGKALNKASKSSQGYSGTLEYSSPEQFNRKLGGSDRRTDIWQVGVLAYEMLTGKLPFEGDDITEIMFAVLNEEPEHPSDLNPEIPREAGDAIIKALEKKKEDRWQSALEFKRALEEVIR